MTPEQARFLLDVTIPTLKQETATTAKVLAATPDANLDYRPSEKCMSGGDLVWHIASADLMFIEGIANGSFSSPPKPEGVTTPQQISAWYAQKMADATEKIAAFTPEEAARIVDFRGIFKLNAPAWVTFSVNHSIHHRGQLSAYLRPMGGKVPSIYGPSADENPFAQAEAAAS